MRPVLRYLGLGREDHGGISRRVVRKHISGQWMVVSIVCIQHRLRPAAVVPSQDRGPGPAVPPFGHIGGAWVGCGGHLDQT